MKSNFAGFYPNRNDTEKFLDSFHVRYTKDMNGRIEVLGDLDLSNKGLQKLPDLSKVVVGGNFSVAGNNLTSLEGCPQDVGGFSCADNHRLESLIGSPKMVKGDFDCSGCHLTDLKGITNSVFGNFNCSYNDLKTLEGGPALVGGDYNCQGNHLTTLKGVPEKIDGNFWCQRNDLTGLEFAPKTVRGDFLCYKNPLESREHLPDEYGRLVTGDLHADEQDDERRRQAKLAAKEVKPPPAPEEPPAAPGITLAAPQPPVPSTPATPVAAAPVTAPPVASAPEQPAADEGHGGSKFLSKQEAERLKALHLKISKHLNISGLDQSHIKVKDAEIDDKKQLHIVLDNNHRLVCGKNPDGSEFIGGASANAPFERKDAEAAVSLAASRGWREINVQGSNEQKAMLFLEAERQGLSVSNPPPEAVINKVRLQQEAQSAAPPPAVAAAPRQPKAAGMRV